MVALIWLLSFFIWVFSYRKDKDRTMKALKNSFSSLSNMFSGILGMVLFVGLVLALFPKETIVDLFTHKGFIGFVVVSLLGAIVTIPGPIAFPLAGALLKMGASKAILASFITTLTMVGIVSAPLEISYLGKRFTLLRQLFSFVAAIFIGLIMGVFL